MLSSFFKRNSQDAFTRLPLHKLLPKIYVISVILGLAATGAQASFLPDFVICSSFFGDNACDPFGNYVVAFVSLPALLLTGKFVPFYQKAPAYFFFLSLFVISLLIYFLIGLLLENLKFKNKTIGGSTKTLVFTILILLIFALAILTL